MNEQMLNNHPAVSDTEWGGWWGQGNTNLSTPTQHRQKCSKEPETHQTKEPDTEGLLQIPFWGRSNDI